MKHSQYLTKTDFKLARTCPTKLYYLRQSYRSTDESNEYLELLKEGGHFIGEIARQQLPQGEFIGIAGGVEEGARRTSEALKQDRITLFEAVFIQDGMLAVVDILEKRGRDLNLIEVKSKSYDSSDQYQIVGKKQQIKSEWQEYIEDVAFQKLVVELAHPEFSVAPYLLLPDKAKRTQIEGLAGAFALRSLSDQEGGGALRVEFLGDKAALLKDDILTRVPIREACAFIAPLVKQEANRFLQILQPQLKRVQYHLGKHCKDCEFRSETKAESGFHECWGELADESPHLFELYFGGALKKDGKYLFDELISQRKSSLFDVPLDAIKGKRGERQSLQINLTRERREWLNPRFTDLLREFRYPLHFIDFETSVSAVPYHKGMRPFEQIAFQWSCHTISQPGAAPVHSEWINLQDSFPSFSFAESLMQALSSTGTIFMWAEHENTTLKDIRRQIAEYGEENQVLAEWIDSVVVSEESAGRLVDMNKLCLEHYFHPMMKGKTSIKYVLPAIWSNNDYLWSIPFLKAYVKHDAQGRVLSPYEALSSIEIGGSKEAVREGTGAMIAYKEMMYGVSKGDSDKKKQWSQLLLQYCELDTLAMVIIFMHWAKLAERGVTGESGRGS